MSLFGSIASRIFGHDETPAPAETGKPEAGKPAEAAVAEAQGVSPAPTPAPAAPPAGEVDVAARLTAMAAQAPETLDWRRSIVDLLKLLGLDSSLTARRQLAQELHYKEDMNDSAAMNIWLHQQVMRKLAENGGRVPEELRN
ncbi:DUF3597 domain-containing protein [Rhodovastum atsumiense]|uniref:DUF3597 domain-containing protein n=1 Tax=Rhodovastum atsumiense TaxID=504468 RepID=A0A5M6INS5_9PROT|nr:DUF3597 domain-containing protein [Rhodovastum atsumiense]KAA5609914.1 DUF3597 domain-containing protein [Rhodovastum atsumiense]